MISMVKTSQEVTDKWKKRLKGSTEEIRKGVDRVTTAPSSEAIKKQEKMLAKLIEAIESGRWKKGLEKYSLEDWKRDMKEKGITRISQGVDSADAKMTEFYDWLLPRVEDGKRKIDAMPDVSLEDNIARMTTYIRHMADKKYKEQ